MTTLWATFVGLTLAAIASAVFGVVANVVSDNRHPLYRRNGVIGAGVFGGLALLVLAAAATTPMTSGTGSSDSAAGPEQSQQARVALGSAAAPSETAPLAGETTPTVMEQSVLDLPKVNVDTTDDIDLQELSSASIDGTTYGRALAYECNLFCNGTSPQTRTFILGRQYTSFSTTAVVLDSAEGTYRIDITCDQQAPRTYEVSAGERKKITLDVAGVDRLRVQLYAAGPLKSAVQSGADSTQGENGGGLPGVALGDPEVQP